MRNHTIYAWAPVLLVSLLLSPVAIAQTTAISVTTPVIEGKGDSNGLDDRYRFEAGPGDVTIAVEATTNYYSKPLEVKLIGADGSEVGNVNVVASDSTGRASRSFHVASHRVYTLTVHADRDQSIKSLDYKVTLGGAVDVAKESSGEVVVAPVPTTDDQLSAATIPTTITDPVTPSFAQMVNGLVALPSTGKLRVEMKDGSVRLIDLAKVNRLTYVQQ